MTISVETVLLGLLSLAAGSFSFILRELWASFKKLQEQVSAMKEELPQQYLQKDDFRTFRSEVLDAIHRLEGYVRQSLPPRN
jgi:hypothetical protein